MEPDDGQDARARRGGLHWRPHPSWNYHCWCTGARSVSASAWHPTSPNGAYLSLRLQQPGDYQRLQGFCPALEIRPQAHGPLDRRPRHCRCRPQALPREHCQFISWDHPSLLHLPSRQRSRRADPLLLKSSWCSHRASLLHHTNRPCSHPGGQQEGDCWLNLPQMELLLPLTLPTRTGEGNKLGDGASEADRPVTPEGDEG